MMYGPKAHPDEQLLVVLHQPHWFVVSARHVEQSPCAVQAVWSGQVVPKNQLLQYSPAVQVPEVGPSALPAMHVPEYLHQPHPLLIQPEQSVYWEQVESSCTAGGVLEPPRNSAVLRWLRFELDWAAAEARSATALTNAKPRDL